MRGELGDRDGDGEEKSNLVEGNNHKAEGNPDNAMLDNRPGANKYPTVVLPSGLVTSATIEVVGKTCAPDGDEDAEKNLGATELRALEKGAPRARLSDGSGLLLKSTEDGKHPRGNNRVNGPQTINPGVIVGHKRGQEDKQGDTHHEGKVEGESVGEDAVGSSGGGVAAKQAGSEFTERGGVNTEE